jgi:hypothetical protein
MSDADDLKNAIARYDDGIDSRFGPLEAATRLLQIDVDVFFAMVYGWLRGIPSISLLRVPTQITLELAGSPVQLDTHDLLLRFAHQEVLISPQGNQADSVFFALQGLPGGPRRIARDQRKQCWEVYLLGTLESELDADYLLKKLLLLVPR